MEGGAEQSEREEKNADESDTEESPAPNKRGNWFMNLLADTPENTP